MKKFALLAMLICAGLVNFGCAEKKKTPPATPPAGTEQKEGEGKQAETPAEPAK